MSHVDALSRYSINIVSVESELKCRLQKAQNSDESLKCIITILKTQPYENYKLIGGVLCKEIDGHEVFVVPRHMEKEIITNAHNNGHFGTLKTIHQIKQQYFIPHLENKVKSIIQNCIKCILFNKKQGKLEGFLQCIDKGDRPLNTIHIDHLGPMDATSKMYKYILAIVDGFTKFVWLFSTKGTGADEVVSKLEFWQSIFGNPQRIISDRGPAFVSNVFEEFCKRNNIEHILITAGVPRGNGQIERINRTILSVISKLSSDKPEHWYKYLSGVQRGINSTYHRSIGRSPFEILFGTKINDNQCGNVVKILKEELINEFDKERENLRNEAKRQIEKVQLENKQNFDRKRKQNVGYKVGDLVAIRRTQFVAGRKLANEYLGPYEIVKVKRNGRYEVRKAASVEGPNITTTN